ncbi:MAG: PIN domain-containing protein [Candidatus Omnitrophota bacterium]
MDTNVFLRFLTRDEEAGYRYCENLFRKAVAGKAMLFTTELVIAEIVWTLSSYYELGKREVIEKVSLILNTQNLEVTNKGVLLDALALYQSEKIDFIDAYNAIVARRHGIDEIHSFDRHFDDVPFLKRIPG